MDQEDMDQADTEADMVVEGMVPQQKDLVSQQLRRLQVRKYS